MTLVGYSLHPLRCHHVHPVWPVVSVQHAVLYLGCAAPCAAPRTRACTRVLTTTTQSPRTPDPDPRAILGAPHATPHTANIRHCGCHSAQPRPPDAGRPRPRQSQPAARAIPIPIPEPSTSPPARGQRAEGRTEGQCQAAGPGAARGNSEGCYNNTAVGLRLAAQKWFVRGS